MTEMSPQERSARRLRLVGVIIFSVVIFGLWGWSIWVKLSTVNWKKSSEFLLAAHAKNDWNTISNNFQTKPLNQPNDSPSAEELVHVALSRLITNRLDASSSTTITASSSIIKN